METLNVQLEDRSYPIHISGDFDALWEKIRTVCESEKEIGLFMDRAVAGTSSGERKRLANLSGVRLLHTFDGQGEPLKSAGILEDVWRALGKNHFSRKSCLFAIGGGVVGDLVGFAAATWNRGIGLYQMPTTLLSMVDSSVGGKTGINTAEGKNLVGAFWQPNAVFIYTGFLRTLPVREFSAGMAEVIKYGLLADRELHEQLWELPRLHAEHESLPGIIRRCCEIKAEVVRMDERETAASGGRALLNLGHTFAHAIENVAGYGDYLHGEAVAIGLFLAARLSEALREHHPDEYQVNSQEVATLRSLLKRYDLPVKLRSPLPVESLMAAMMHDKKVRSGQLRLVAMHTIGDAVTVESVDTALIESLWREVGAVCT